MFYNVHVSRAIVVRKVVDTGLHRDCVTLGNMIQDLLPYPANCHRAGSYVGSVPGKTLLRQGMSVVTQRSTKHITKLTEPSIEMVNNILLKFCTGLETTFLSNLIRDKVLVQYLFSSSKGVFPRLSCVNREKKGGHVVLNN
jgi:hypothetical protein